jgi:hypothetical protein
VKQSTPNVGFWYESPSSGWTGNIEGSTNAEDSQWHHVVMVQRSKTDRELFVDGVSNGTNTQDPGTISHNTASIGLLRTTWTADPFKGVIDDVRIYDSALSSGEITSLGATPPTDCAAGPVAHWDFDEGTGITAADSAGTNDGTLTNGPTWACLVGGYALDLDGTDDYVDAGSDPSLDVSNGTVAAWFKANGPQIVEHTIVDKNWAGLADGELMLMIQDSDDTPSPNHVRLYLENGVSDVSIFSDAPVAFGTWTHVAVTFGSSGMTMYIDGVLQADTNANTSGMDRTGPSLLIGVQDNNAADVFDGLIDDVLIYDRVLSGAEIATLAGTAPTDCAAGPIAHWNLDEGTGQTAADSAGTSDGTLGSTTGADANDPTWTCVNGGNALDFDGTDDYVDLDSHIGNYAALSEGSISIWFNYTDTSDFKLLFSASANTDASSDIDIMYYQPDNVFMSGIREDGVNVWNCSFPAPYSDGNWHHYVMNVDSSGNSHYVDGSQITCNYHASVFQFGHGIKYSQDRQ